MAIASFTEPTVALKAKLPDYSPIAFDTFYKNTKNSPIANIASIMDGIPMPVDYFNQRLKPGQDAQFLDSSLSPTIQQYNAIANTILYVQEPLSSSIDDNNNSSVTGSALLHSSIRPIIGDVFTTTVLGGETGLFKVTEAKQAGYNKDSNTLIEYQLHEYVDDNSPLLEELDQKSDRRFFYEKEELDKGHDPVISMEDHHNRISLSTYIQSVGKDYYRDFYNTGVKTFTVPNSRGMFYDDYIVRFIKLMFDKIGLSSGVSDINRFTVRDNDISVTTIFSALEDRTRLFTDSITTDIGILTKNSFVGRARHGANLIKYSPVEYIAKTVSPKYAGQLTSMKGFLSGEVLGDTISNTFFLTNNLLVEPLVRNGIMYWVAVNDINPEPDYLYISYPGMSIVSLRRVIVGNVSYINPTSHDILVPTDISKQNMINAGFRLTTPNSGNVVTNIRYPIGKSGLRLETGQVNLISGRLWTNTSTVTITIPTDLSESSLLSEGLSVYTLMIQPAEKVFVDAVLWVNITSAPIGLPYPSTELDLRRNGFVKFVANATIIPTALVTVSYTIAPDEFIHIENSTYQNVTTADIIYDGGTPVPVSLVLWFDTSLPVKVLGDTLTPGEIVKIAGYQYVNLTNADIIVNSLIIEDLLLLGLSVHKRIYQEPEINQVETVQPNADIIVGGVKYTNITTTAITVSMVATEAELLALGLIIVVEPTVAIAGLVVTPNMVVEYDHIRYVNNTLFDITLPNPINAIEIIAIGLERVNIDSVTVEVVKPVFVDEGYYIFSKEFYDSNKESMSVLELLVFTYLKNDPIDTTELMRLYNSYKTWSKLQKFYFTPVLIMLSDYVLSTYRSPWRLQYEQK